MSDSVGFMLLGIIIGFIGGLLLNIHECRDAVERLRRIEKIASGEEKP